jgi:glucose-6-phosphate 1-dehydrogenase
VNVVIFGASGDLTRRKLVPALYRLERRGLLPEGLRVFGFSRTKMSDKDFRDWLREAIETSMETLDESTWSAFAQSLHYVPGDIGNGADFKQLDERIRAVSGSEGGRLYYMAVAPRFFAPAVAALGDAGMVGQAGDWRRVVVEKPFGRDRTSAEELNGILHGVFAEDQVYRIDHYLGKETAQNLVFLRFANSVFEPVWNRNYIDHVQITVAERVEVGHRAGYYDRAGVLRDMFQNHLLQLFTLIAMEPPAPYNAGTLRDEKVKVLSATRCVDPERTVCAQYDGYRQTEGVAPSSRTPTFAALELGIDNWRWQGVPFFLRSGKALSRKTSEVAIVFKRPPQAMFERDGVHEPNVLSLCIQPDEGVHFQIDAKVPGESQRTRPVQMEFHYRSAFEHTALPDAYERLLLDALAGDPSLFARNDEIEGAWRLIDPVVDAWERSDRPPARYAPGSLGPIEADRLLAASGRQWVLGCGGHV